MTSPSYYDPADDALTELLLDHGYDLADEATAIDRHKREPLLWDIETIDGDYVHLHITGAGLLRIPHEVAREMANSILSELQLFHESDDF